MPISNLDKMHYPFCSDLGDKVVMDSEWPEKINFALFKIKQLIGGGGLPLDDIDWTKDIEIPGIYEIQKVNRISEMFNVVDKEYQTFIAPSDYSQEKFLYVNQKQLTIPIPGEIFQQRHLPTHSTFQFYFLNNSLFTANLLYLDIDDNQQMRVHWAIKANPAGTYVVFRSGHIFFKWKIEVRQGIVNMTLVKVAIDGVSQAIKGATKAVGSFFGIDTSGVDKAKEEIASNLVGKDRGGSFMERERNQRIQEQQTARMFQSTLQHSGDNPIEPSIFYSNSVKFPYNLFDFWLRTEQKAFICRWYYSNNLLNNLKHNNNGNPITYPLNITFEKLGHILRPGFYQGKLDLDYDPGGRMAECFARGVTFYEDKKKHFVNPDLGVKEAVNHIQYSSFGASQGYTAQAIVEGGEPTTVPSNRPKGSNYHQRGHYFIFYEDGTQEHWMALYPMFQNDQLAKGHSHGAFILEFSKPVAKMVDIYTCIGCGAQGTPLFDALHSNYRNSNSDSWNTIHNGLPFEPWYSAMCSAVAYSYDLTVNGQAGRLGSQGDVWEKATQQRSDGKSFVKAYGYVPGGDTITWDLTDENKNRIIFQKQPGHDDFSALDWTPPAGSGGEIEIPLTDPEITMPEPGEDVTFPEDDPVPDPLDPSGGEPEIPPIEPDLPNDIDPGQDPDEFPEINPPEISPPEVDPNDPDTGQDPDTGGDYNLPPDIPADDDDAD